MAFVRSEGPGWPRRYRAKYYKAEWAGLRRFLSLAITSSPLPSRHSLRLLCSSLSLSLSFFFFAAFWDVFMFLFCFRKQGLGTSTREEAESSLEFWINGSSVEGVLRARAVQRVWGVLSGFEGRGVGFEGLVLADSC